MPDSTRESDTILSAAGKSLVANRDHGGIHRSAESIGRFSAEAKSKHWKNRIKRILIAVGAIWATSVVAGLILENGLQFVGIVLTTLAIVAAIGVLWNFPKTKVPKRNDLMKGDAKQMVANTELWLEAQRPALPAPAVQLIDTMGVQLDALGVQLATVDQNDPNINEVRELVGEYIPETIDNYRKIPEHLRKETHAGKTADDRLVDSLTKLSGEVDRVTRRLAEGALDDLAIKDRYLEYRYGGPEALEDQTK